MVSWNLYLFYFSLIVFFLIFRGEIGEPGEDGLKGDAGEALGFEINSKGEKGIMGPPGRRGSNSLN